MTTNLRKLPTKINLKYEAQHRSNFSGYYPADTFTRLAESVQGIASDIEVNFSCKFDHFGHPYLEGSAKCNVKLICMRCYEEFIYPLEVKFSYTAVKDIFEKYDDLPYELLEYNEYGDIELKDAIEDELMVEIPLNPKEETENCKFEEDKVFTFGDEIKDENTENSKTNPFAVLQELKNSGKLLK